ncbi:MAG: hypothetical protein MUE44_09850 [Oscillatoriaceae cyanobacterium Prado104]|jgi:type I restriction enzyme S subunit|nr:hypothetical protein [Oscillatoriaceae cyanobacterium Prado104]
MVWSVKKLSDIAELKVSNVDKKVYSNEKSIKLCNYLDVYLNDYITNAIQFMDGSANDTEIENFSLNIGDVIITKDSETPMVNLRKYSATQLSFLKPRIKIK